MSSLNKNTFLKSFMFYSPTLVLFLSVLNEIDLNYLDIEYFSFNFVYILVFYWTLKNPHYLSYGSIFLAGLINDVVTGIPMGISSLCYLLICTVTAYLRNITLSLDFIFSIDVNYMRYFINSGFTFVFYPLFLFLFNNLEKKIKTQKND